MKNKILIIAYHFAPENSIAAIRPTKLGKYLSINGYDVDVISCNTKSLISDRILLADMEYFNKIYAFDLNRLTLITNYIRKMLKKLTNNKGNFIPGETKRLILVYPILRFMSYLFEIINQYLFAFKALKGGINFEVYDIIFSTYGPFSPNIIAQKIKSKYPKVFWIADFRDPVLQTTVPKFFHGFAKSFTQKYITNPDIVTFVNEDVLNLMNIKSKNRKIVLSNGFDVEDKKFIEKNYSLQLNESDKFIFLYTGTMYSPIVSFEPLFLILRKIIDNNIYSINQFEFHYAGNDFNLMFKETEKYNLSEILVNHGFLERIDALKLQNRANVVIFTGHHSKDIKMTTGGKLFEYMIFDKPVVALLSGDQDNSFLKSILTFFKSSFLFEESNYNIDLERLYNYIINLINRAENQKPNLLDDSKVNPYSYNYLALKLISNLPR